MLRKEVTYLQLEKHLGVRHLREQLERGDVTIRQYIDICTYLQVQPMVIMT